MSLLRIALLLVAWASYYISYTSPNPPASEATYQNAVSGLWTRIFMQNQYSEMRARMQKIFVSGMMLLEIVFASDIPAIRQLLPNAKPPVDSPSFVSPLLVLGVFCALSGALLRVWSFRTLGTHFTFQLTFLKEHKLVTTGPYAYVRHPSYTALLTIVFGMLLCESSGGSWYIETGAFKTPLGTAIALLAGCCVAIALSVASRAPKEDRLLSEKFGKEWKEWEKRVPYRFIPGIL